MTARRWLGLAAFVALVLVGGRLVASVYVDYRWYATLGAGALSVWRARVADLALMRVLLGLASAAYVFAQLYWVSTSVESLVLPRRLGDLEIGEKVPGRRLLWFAAIIALVVGALLSLVVDDWMSFDLVQFARPFGVAEPYTDSDLAFFVYWLPLENALYLWAIATLLAASALVIVLYVLTAGLRWEHGRLRATRHVRRHLTALAAALLLVLAWGHRLDAYSLLWAGSGPSGAYTVVDDAVIIVSRFALAVVTAIAALVMVILEFWWRAQPRLTLWAISVVLALTVLLRAIVPALGTRIVGVDDVARRNVPYAQNRAAMTQTAYGVNRVQRAAPTYGMAGAAGTAGVAPVWDPTALAHAIERQRRGEIVADDIGWQSYAGQLAAIAVMRPASLSDAEPPTWPVVTTAGAVADASGDAVFVDSAGAPVAAQAAREHRLLSFPQASGYAVVSDTTGRLAADGVSTFWSRLAHAWDLRDLRLLVTDAIDRIDHPAIVLRRGVRERIEAVAPFFVQGHVVTPLLARDTVYWSCHLYAASTYFPLSQRYNVAGTQWGYFQHAAVALVNGETGRVILVADPAPDRLSDAWARRFPALFTDPNALPPALAAALPPATDGVLLQAWALAQYGSRADLTAGPVRLAGGDGGDSTVGLAPRAFVLLPTVTGRERVAGWTLPLIDPSDRVAGALVALGGPRPVTLWVPNASAGARWSELAERLRLAAPVNSDAPDARDVVRGRVLTLPLRGRFGFAQAIYTVRADSHSSLASIAGVVDDTARVGRTVAEALGASRSSSGASAAATPGSPETPGRLRSLYDAMRAALRKGDWAAFGAAFDSLGAAISRVP